MQQQLVVEINDDYNELVKGSLAQSNYYRGGRPYGEHFKERHMPWYAWLILVVAIGSIVGGLLMLRDSANKVELTDEQRKRVAERNAQADAKDLQDR